MIDELGTFQSFEHSYPALIYLNYFTSPIVYGIAFSVEKNKKKELEVNVIKFSVD